MYEHRPCSSRTLNYRPILYWTIAHLIPYLFITIHVFTDPQLHQPIRNTFIATTFFFLMNLWSYYQVVMVDPGRIPDMYSFPSNYPFSRRYCLSCRTFKPERSHHCSICNRCNLCMNSHVVVASNCVGFFNRRYFLQCLFYSVLFSSTAVFFLKNYLSAVKQPNKNLLSYTINFLFLIEEIIIVIGCTITFCIHFRLLAINKTMFEYQMGQNQRAPRDYDRGIYENFKEVFGYNPIFWLIPINNAGYLTVNGLGWPWQQQQQNQLEID